MSFGQVALFIKYDYSVLNSIWTKSGLTEFWKNTLQLFSEGIPGAFALCN